MLTNDNYRPLDDGVLMFKTEELILRGETNDAFLRLNDVIQRRPKSIIAEVNIYRKYVPVILKSIIQMNEIKKAAALQAERVTTDNEDKKYQRWTEQEDNLLIDLVADEKMSMLELSTTMGRTVPAIKTRLSTLVGRKRISQNIAGRFIGFIDGEHKEAEVNGKLIRT